MKFSRKQFNLPLVFIILFSFILNVTRVNAAPGDLDLGFSSDGIVTHSGIAGGVIDVGTSIYVTSSNKVFVAGKAFNSSYQTLMALWKYNADGTLDTSFSSDGLVTQAGTAGGTNDEAYGVAVDSQGRVVVAGISKNEGNSQTYMAVWRYTSSGSLDTGFSGDGKWTSVDVNPAQTYGVAVDSNDKVYIVGRYQSQMTVWRLTSSGSLDTGFSSDGIMTDYGGGNGSYGYDIDIDSNGKLVVAGKAYIVAQSRWEPTVWRINTDGTLDTSFSSDGVNRYFITGGKEEYARGIAVGASNVLAVTGTMSIDTNSDSTYEGRDLFVLKLESDGDLDTTFSSDGIVQSGYSTSEYDWTQGHATEFDSVGNIIVTGEAHDDGQNEGALILRYNSGGSLDSDFSTDGIVYLTSTSGQRPYEGDALDIDSNGKILITGERIISGVNHMLLMRLRGGEINSVGVDIRPGECENLLDVDSAGVLTVAIEGTSTFDVSTIDTTTVKLAGISPLQSFVQDMAHATTCSDPSDAYSDLIVRFRISSLPGNLQSLSTGQTSNLELVADLTSGGSIVGSDTVEIIND